MIKKFISEDFLLNNRTAVWLFHDVAADLPIIDYHTHLCPKEIFEDKKFGSIAEAWLAFDHYKWRAMRSNGVPEYFITGEASGYEKFRHWCETLPYLMGNPLYHWAHLELQRYFDIYDVISPETCDKIWGLTQEKLQHSDLSARNVLRMSKVEWLCTTDDPSSDLGWHKRLARDNFEVGVLPTFRGDELFYIERKERFVSWIGKLATASGKSISTLDDLLSALDDRYQFFHDHGCRLSDLGLVDVPFKRCSEKEIDRIFMKALEGQELSSEEVAGYKTHIFLYLGRKNHEFGWTQQFHIGVLDNPNRRRLETLGSATGFSCINDTSWAANLADLLSELDYSCQLAKSVLYGLNPRDNHLLCALIGTFQDSDCGPGKIQAGTAWWFNDNIDGMRAHMKTLGNLGVFGRFVGMLTDSRSLLSFPRHEYFRRIMCNLVGEWVESGEYPNDKGMLKKLVSDISYGNASGYFNIRK